MRTRSGYSPPGEIARSGKKGNENLSGRGLAILKVRELSVQYAENLSAYALGPWLAFRLMSFFCRITRGHSEAAEQRDQFAVRSSFRDKPIWPRQDVMHHCRDSMGG
jgi:hypothetical protein